MSTDLQNITQSLGLVGGRGYSRSRAATGSPAPHRSCAEWPEGTLCYQVKQVTTDDHHSKECAEAICSRLAREGFGGERKIFPLRVWTEPIEDKENSPVHEREGVSCNGSSDF